MRPTSGRIEKRFGMALAALLLGGIMAHAATYTKVLQTGLNGYAGVDDMELRDPVQGTTGATWHSWRYLLSVQMN